MSDLYLPPGVHTLSRESQQTFKDLAKKNDGSLCLDNPDGIARWCWWRYTKRGTCAGCKRAS